MKRAAILLGVGVFLAVSCENREQESQISNVNFTPCQQSSLKSSVVSDKIDVEFINNGIQITYRNFEVTCDFTAVNVTHTFVNGVLNITQQASPNQAKCICYTDVSYTINGISQDEVNVIFINGEQVYCHSENYPIEISFIEYSLAETSCQWKRLSYPYPYSDTVVIINNKEDLGKYIECIGECDYPVIDFSTQTLLFAHGIAPSSVVNVSCSSLLQFSEQSYEMKVEIVVGDATVMSDWQVPIIINKLGEKCIIELICYNKIL